MTIALKNILKEKFFLHKQSQQDMESLLKRIITLVIQGARKTQNAMEKNITELHNRLNPSGPGKRMNSSTQKNLYFIREDIIHEMSNTEDEKLDIATYVMMIEENQ